MDSGNDTLGQIRDVVLHDDRGVEKTGRIAEMIRASRGYRWVGIYEVRDAEISAIAWTGTEAPAYPRFPVTQGLCGAAVESRAPVVVGDVREDPRYLTTFGSTRAEMVVPVLDEGKVAGLIDVESERPDAFGDEDAAFLQSCASEILPVFR
jgi:L-methionine (R)-S-oxide reductase